MLTCICSVNNTLDIDVILSIYSGTLLCTYILHRITPHCFKNENMVKKLHDLASFFFTLQD